MPGPLFTGHRHPYEVSSVKDLPGKNALAPGRDKKIVAFIFDIFTGGYILIQ